MSYSYFQAPTHDAWERIVKSSSEPGNQSLLEQLRYLLARNVFPLVLQHVAGYAGEEGAVQRRIYALSMLQDDTHLFRLIRKIEGDVQAAALAMARSLAWKLLVRKAGQKERGVWTVMPLEQHSTTLVSGDPDVLNNDYSSASDSSSPLFWMNGEMVDAGDRPVVVASIRTLSISTPEPPAEGSGASLPEHSPIKIKPGLIDFPEFPGETTADVPSDGRIIEEVEAFLAKEGDEISGVNAYLLAGLEMARLAIDYAYQRSLDQGKSTPVVQATLVIDLRPSKSGNSLSIAKSGMELLPELERLSKRHFVSLWSGVHVVGFGWIHAGLWAFAKKILPPSAAERVRFPSSPADVRKIWYDPPTSSTKGFPLGVGGDDNSFQPTEELDRPAVHASTNTGLQKWSRWVPGADLNELEVEEGTSWDYDYDYDDGETNYDDFKTVASGTTRTSHFATPMHSRIVSPAASDFVTPLSSRPSSPVRRRQPDTTVPRAAKRLRRLQRANQLNSDTASQHTSTSRASSSSRAGRVSRYDAANPYFGYPAVMRGGVGLRAANCSLAGVNGTARVEAASRRKRHLARTLAYLLALRVVSFPVHLWAAVVNRLPRAIAVALGGMDQDDGMVHVPPGKADNPVPASMQGGRVRIFSGSFVRIFLRTLALTFRAIWYPLQLLFPRLAHPRPSAITTGTKNRTKGAPPRITNADI